MGEEVRTDSGPRLVVAVAPVVRRTRVYDISVFPNANYFANGILVHNKLMGVSPAEHAPPPSGDVEPELGEF